MEKTKKEIYFEFYDKLPYPINAWAKLNYDDSFSEHVPKSFLEVALVRGWDWHNSKFIKSSHFWDSVRLNVHNKSALLTLAKNAIRNHFFNYYDQISDKIIADKAKFNYDNHLKVCDLLREWLPSDTDEALGSGFSFEHTPEGYDYWRAILNSLPSDTLKKSTETMSPRKQKSFEFYDQLPSPIKEWAKENFDERYSTCVPSTIGIAVFEGWHFGKSKNSCNNGFWFRVANIDIDDPIEVKRLTDEALNCKISSKTETMSDLKKTYFKFYEELPPLLCEWACANFDEEFAKNKTCALNLAHAIHRGWKWDDSKYGNYYLWQSVTHNANNLDALVKIEIENKISTKSNTESSLTPHTRSMFKSLSDHEFDMKMHYFKIYDSLAYPMCEMAKANFNYEFAKTKGIVSDLSTCLLLGWDFTYSKYGNNRFWSRVVDYYSPSKIQGHNPSLIAEAREIYKKGINTISFNLNNSNQNQNEKQKSEGIKVRKLTPSISTGERRISNPIQGARSKTSIAIGHLSNAKISTCG